MAVLVPRTVRLRWRRIFTFSPLRRVTCAPVMGVILEVQVLPLAGHSERSEAQLQKGDRLWEGSVERKP